MPGFPARLPLLWCRTSPRRAPGLQERCGLTEILNAWGKKSTRWSKIKSHKIPAKHINRKTSSFHRKHFSFGIFFLITNFWAMQMLFILCILSFNVLFSFKKQNFNGKWSSTLSLSLCEEATATFVWLMVFQYSDESRTKKEFFFLWKCLCKLFVLLQPSAPSVYSVVVSVCFIAWNILLLPLLLLVSTAESIMLQGSDMGFNPSCTSPTELLRPR